jgi:hypothetical protein
MMVVASRHAERAPMTMASGSPVAARIGACSRSRPAQLTIATSTMRPRRSRELELYGSRDSSKLLEQLHLRRAAERRQEGGDDRETNG